MIMKSLAARSATWVLPSLNSITLSGRQSNYGSYRCTFQPLLGVKLPGASGFCINSGMLQSWGNPMNRAMVIAAAVVLTLLMPSTLLGCGPKGTRWWRRWRRPAFPVVIVAFLLRCPHRYNKCRLIPTKSGSPRCHCSVCSVRFP